MDIKTCKCGQECDDCRCDNKQDYAVNVDKAIKQFYESSQHEGLHRIDDVLDFVRKTSQRNIGHGYFFDCMIKLRRDGKINYRLKGNDYYEFEEIGNVKRT